MKIKEKIKILFALPKTIYFNFKILKFKDAVKLPFLVYPCMKIGNLHKNGIIINGPIKKFMIKIGEKNLDGIPEISKGFINVAPNAKIEFNGMAVISCGSTINAVENGRIVFGNNFYCNKNCMIVSRELIRIGNDVLCGWNVNIRDNDGANHYIIKNNEKKKNKNAISIGNHSWLCSETHILKGVNILDDTVVAYNSCVTKSFDKSNIILGGYPAKIIDENIQWKR